MKVKFVIPPLVELHSPYPSTAYLSGYFEKLRLPGVSFSQTDIGIKFFHEVFGEKGLIRLREYLLTKYRARAIPPDSVRLFLEHFDEYHSKIKFVVAFLTGQDTSLARRMSRRGYLPLFINGDETWFYEQHICSGQLEKFFGSNFIKKWRAEEAHQALDPLTFSFGDLGVHDRARYLSTLFLKEIAKVIKEGIDEEFTLTDFGDKLCDSAYLFEPIRQKLEGPPTVLDEILDDVTADWVTSSPAEVVGISIPHPGTMYGALRIARQIKRLRPETYVVAGGGYINGQLRGLKETRVFDYFDFLTLDRGYKPLEQILRFLRGECDENQLYNTLVLEEGDVAFKSNPGQKEIHHREVPAPDYTGINMSDYLSLLDILAPVESLWNSIKWNRMNLTYGCYWAKCTFCPVNLDYIGKFEPSEVDFLINHMKSVIASTGSRGFYFVDKAMPPKLLKQLCKRILEENLQVTWWGYVRFDRNFTPELAQLMADAGCIAVLCGLESGSDRVLKFMDKGTNIKEVVETSYNLSKAGILVHGYLIYGFPHETLEEILNTLEFARQLFKAGCLHSVSWNQLFVTQYSLLGSQPAAYGINLKPLPKAKQFANYVRDWEYIDSRERLWFTDKVCMNGLGRGLINAGLRYNHFVGFDKDIRTWFYGLELPKPTLPPAFVDDIIANSQSQEKPMEGIQAPPAELNGSSAAPA